ncbi:restriction endonuclease subunit S [Paraburkholderia sp. BR10923]|uniref:restriction endonuclease subunit S n=1 Tax=Paraburkholderia sp. BR10923 TaxID=3236992 RepID=UPI0034CFED35
MKSEWTRFTIGDLVRSGEAAIQTGPFGSQLHKHDYVDSGTPVIPTEAIGRGRILDIDVPQISEAKAEELTRHRLSSGDILFARRGVQATGLSAIVDRRYAGAICGTGALLLRVQSARVDPHYLSLFLSSDESFNWLRSHAVGAVMPNLNTDIIKALPITLPSIGEQRGLSRFLGALDDRIALLRETNATFEAIAQALFKSWFVDFDPVRAKAEGREPEGLDADTAALFPDGFEESELGLVPTGWIADGLEKCCDKVESGGTPKRTKPEYWGGTVDWLTSGEVRNAVILGTKEKITEVGVRESAAKVWPAGTTVVAMYGATAGEACILAKSVAANQACCGLRPLPDHRSFLFLVTRRESQNLASKSSGSAQQNLNKGLVSRHRVVIPPKALMTKFEGIAGSLIDAWISNEISMLALTDIRDTLLPRLLSGQLRIPEAEKVLEETV